MKEVNVSEDQWELLMSEMDAQDGEYGRFASTIAGLRLGVACLEDEVREMREAWREGRHASSWSDLRDEALQVAAIAMRLYRDAR